MSMIVDNCRFDPKKDLTPVSQTGFIDLKSAFVSGVVPSVMQGADADYNGIDDPQSILGCPSDVFEAIEMQSHINAYTPPASGEKE